MRNSFRLVLVVLSTLTLFGVVNIATVSADDKSAIEQGKKISVDTKKGNCLACHLIVGGEQAGNVGPPLIAMKTRFSDKAALRAQISDARTKNPNTIMPPFGAHEILTQDEIDKVVEYIYSL